MLQVLTIAEFCQLEPNNTFIINIGNGNETVTVVDYPFYNRDTTEPGWEVETDAGFIAFGSAYRNIPLPDINNCRLITLEEFQRLEDGNVINVRCNNELIQTTVRGVPFESCNLDNILGDGGDWEVETPIGFVHNDCVYVEV